MALACWNISEATLERWRGQGNLTPPALLPCSTGIQLRTEAPKQQGVRPVHEGLYPCRALAQGGRHQMPADGAGRLRNTLAVVQKSR